MLAGAGEAAPVGFDSGGPRLAAQHEQMMSEYADTAATKSMPMLSLVTWPR